MIVWHAVHIWREFFPLKFDLILIWGMDFKSNSTLLKVVKCYNIKTIWLLVSTRIVLCWNVHKAALVINKKSPMRLPWHRYMTLQILWNFDDVTKMFFEFDWIKSKNCKMAFLFSLWMLAIRISSRWLRTGETDDLQFLKVSKHYSEKLYQIVEKAFNFIFVIV